MKRKVKHWNRLPREAVECSENMGIWHLRIWFSGKHGIGAGLTIGLVLKCLLEP